MSRVLDVYQDRRTCEIKQGSDASLTFAYDSDHLANHPVAFSIRSR